MNNALQIVKLFKIVNIDVFIRFDDAVDLFSEPLDCLLFFENKKDHSCDEGSGCV